MKRKHEEYTAEEGKGRDFPGGICAVIVTCFLFSISYFSSCLTCAYLGLPVYYLLLDSSLNTYRLPVLGGAVIAEKTLTDLWVVLSRYLLMEICRIVLNSKKKDYN